MLIRPLRALGFVALLAAGCDDGGTGGGGGSAGGENNTGGGGGGVVNQGAAGPGGGDGGTGGTVEPGPGSRRTMSGDITWTVAFDATAQTAGATDCSYVRHYEGVEDSSQPWLCPSCEVMFRATVEMTSGKEDCYSQVSEFDPAEEEWLGYANGVMYRGVPITAEFGTMTLAGNTISAQHSVADLEVTAGGTMSFGIAGELALGVEEGEAHHGFVAAETYTCGWPKADPAPYTGDYSIVEGQTVPDGVFLDGCGENVRLHDFKGAYLLIDMAARDCPPCQAMAGEEEAFVADMAAQGITVHVITLMAPSLSDVFGKTTKAMLTTWTENFELTSPVLADRAWGLSMFIPIFGDVETGYPSWVLVDPDLNVMETGTGFGGFEELKTSILADQ